MMHVVFGTGAIGVATLRALPRRDEKVRLVSRSGTRPPGVPDSVEGSCGGGWPGSCWRPTRPGRWRS